MASCFRMLGCGLGGKSSFRDEENDNNNGPTLTSNKPSNGRSSAKSLASKPGENQAIVPLTDSISRAPRPEVPLMPAVHVEPPPEDEPAKKTLGPVPAEEIPAPSQIKPLSSQEVSQSQDASRQHEAPQAAEASKPEKQSHRDLWDEAYDKLQREQPKVFASYKRCVLEADDGGSSQNGDSDQQGANGRDFRLDQLKSDERERYLATQIEKKVQTIHQEEWATATKVYKNTVNAVLFAKAFITQVASNEPHAALAWAGVSLFLPLLLKPDEQRQAATDALENVSQTILRYRVVELTFRDRSKSVISRDEETALELIKDSQTKIVNLYSEILEFQFRLARYYSRHTLSKYMHDIVGSNDWKGLHETIKASDANIKYNLEVIGSVFLDEELHAQAVQLQKFANEAVPILKSLHSGLTRFIASEAQKVILNHLAPDIEAVDTREGFESGHWHHSSGEWLKISNEYQTWWISEGGLLWCTGVAGAGKTVLANIIANDLNARFAADVDKQVIKVFFDYHYIRSRKQCLASMWKQLASRRPFDDDELAILDKMYVKQRTNPDEAKWMDMLSHEARRYSRVYLIADALDESSVKKPLQFVEELLTLLPRVNVLITTRPEFNVNDIHANIKVTTIQIEAHEMDLKKYAETRITQSDNLPQVIKRKPELEEKIKDQITNNAKGMFLLAKLLLDDLESTSKPSVVQRKLDNPPQNLNEAYDASVLRIESQSGDASIYGKEVIYTLCIAKIPLTFEQMRCLLSLEEDSETLEPDDYIVDGVVMGSSAGLIILDRDTKIVRFGHETTRQYLHNFHADGIEQARLILLKKCLTYLRFQDMRLEYWSDDDQIRQRVMHSPLLEYAAVYWGDLAREVGTDDKEDLVSDIMDLLSKPENLACALRVLLWKSSRALIERHRWGAWGMEQKTKGKMRAINIVAYCGLDNILARLIQTSPDSYLHSSDPFVTVIHWAVRGNHGPVLNRLMSLPRIKEIINQFSELAHTPLHIALEFSRTLALEILLKNGADPTLKIHREPDWHSLELAIWKGPPNHVAILLDSCKIQPSKLERLLWTRDILGRLALNIATDADDIESLRLLLPLYAESIERSHGVQELVDAMSRNPLHQAAQSGRHRSTETILDHSLGREFARGTNYRGQTPFETAAFSGRTTVVRSYHGRLNRDWFLTQQNTLVYAALRGHSETLHELLEVFSEAANAQDLYRRTLLCAVDNGNIDSFKDVISRMQFKNSDPGLTQIFFMAAEKGHVEVIIYLLEKGTPVNSQDVLGRTALHLAVNRCMTSVVRALLDADCALEIKSKAGVTPLELAIRQRHSTSSMWLVHRGSVVPELDTESKNWLHNQPWWAHHNQLEQAPPKPKDVVFSPTSADEVFRAALCVQRLLGSSKEKVPLVNWILELAEYHVLTESQREGEHWYDENDPSPVYLRSLPLPTCSRKVHNILFQVSSHDQSSGSGPGDFGGYTWFSLERQMPSGLRTNRTRLLKNRHHRGDWTEFNVQWPHREGFDLTPDMPNEAEKARWLSGLGAGDRVLILPKAELQAWRNFVRRVEVKIYSTCLRRVIYRGGRGGGLSFAPRNGGMGIQMIM